MFIKGPETPEYKDAKGKLESYVLSTSQMQKSVNNMTKRIKELAHYYLEFGQKLFATWLPDAPPAVAQADEIATKNAATFETLVDTFINQLGPQFYNLLIKHDSEVKELQALDKKMCGNYADMDKKDKALKSAQSAKEPVEAKIQAAQVQYDQSKSIFDETYAQLLEAVSAFGEKRNTTLLEAFQNFMAMFCQLVNQASLLQLVDFPEDQNADVVSVPEPKPVAIPASKPAPAPAATPAPAPTPAPAAQPPAQQPYTPPVSQPEPQPEPIPEEPYNPPAPEPEQPSYTDNSYNNTYNDTSYTQQSYNDTSYTQQSYNDTSYNQQSYNEPATQPNTTPSYAYDAPADTSNQNTTQDAHQTKNPFDEDEDGWGSNPFG